MKPLLYVTMLLAATALSAPAQTVITEAELTSRQADSLVSFYNRAGTTRLTGDSRLQNELQGDLAVLAGELVLRAAVSGSVVIINGSVRFEPGARVDGDVHVIGGPVYGADLAAARSIVIYRELIRYELQDGVLMHRAEVQRDELSAGRRFGFGRTDFVVAARGGYNRVEGLPVHLGPRVALGNRNPTILQASLIARTAELDEPGFIFRLEQFLGGRRAARIGIRWADEVSPIEQWGLSDRENSLSTFVMHRDYRDHFVQRGWSTYLHLGRPGVPAELTLTYARFDAATAPVNDPITLLYNDEPWRREPRQTGAHYATIGTEIRYDTRNDQRDPADGWHGRGGLEGEVGDARYRYAFIDLRRYARLTPNSKIALRGVVAGSLNGDSLPAFRQQALGGESSLPAYEPYQFDCGGHAAQPGEGTAPYYGCDRMALLQVEYQSNFRAFSRFARQFGRDFGLLNNIRWVAFIDAGRAWTETAATGIREEGTSDFIADAGVGLRFGVLGVYWATPLTARASGTNFFIRLGPRL